MGCGTPGLASGLHLPGDGLHLVGDAREHAGGELVDALVEEGLLRHRLAVPARLRRPQG